MLNDYPNLKYGLFISIASVSAIAAFVGLWMMAVLYPRVLGVTMIVVGILLFPAIGLLQDLRLKSNMNPGKGSKWKIRAIW